MNLLCKKIFLPITGIRGKRKSVSSCMDSSDNSPTSFLEEKIHNQLFVYCLFFRYDVGGCSHQISEGIEI